MASNTAKAAHRGDGGDLRNSQSGRADGSENRRFSDQTQLVTPRLAALPDLQVRWLTRLFPVSSATAAALAPLVFGEAA
jgi:hypothetical protein